MRAKLQEVRRRVAILRHALLLPTAEEVRRPLAELVAAVADLSSIEHELRFGTAASRDQSAAELSGELKALKNELRMVHRLIDHSAAFYRGWADLFGSATGGYTPSGQAAPLNAPAAICIEG